MSEPVTEKAPVDRTDYEGLQLDTRAKDETEKHMDAELELESPQSPHSPEQYQVDCRDEKASIARREAEEARRSRAATAIVEEAQSPLTPRPEHLSHNGLEAVFPATQPRVRRICGLRQKHFWISFVLILAIVILAAVLGGVAAMTRRNSLAVPATSPIPSTPTGSGNGSSNIQLPGIDVIVDSPLQMVSFNNSAQQAFRVYYQSVSGEIREIQSNGGSPPSWSPARPIFTDAVNNTGLATITYMNGSNPQSSIFYVGQNGYIQEKRNYKDLPAWEPGTNAINTINLRAVITPLGESTGEDPQNNVWDSARMAAVYSADFYGGPQARFFYHSQTGNGTRVLQEMIWIQSNDSWKYGETLTRPWANSHLAVTVDSTTQTLRLFYSAGKLTLQEAWLNISEADATWQIGISVPSVLAHNDANLAAVSVGGSTLVYYYAAPVGGVVSIRELNLTGTPGTPAYQSNSDGFAARPLPVVAQPQLVTNGVPSLYQPIVAAVSTLTNAEPQIYVCWAEQNESPESGYGALKTVSRYVDIGWGSSSAGAGGGQVTLPIWGA